MASKRLRSYTVAQVQDTRGNYISVHEGMLCDLKDLLPASVVMSWGVTATSKADALYQLVEGLKEQALGL